EGVFFGASDVAAALSVCTIDRALAARLFGNVSPVGKLMFIGDSPFLVVGVIEVDDAPRLQGNEGETPPSVFVPYTSMMRRLKRDPFLAIQLRAQVGREIPALKASLADFMEARRGKRRADFRFWSVADSVQVLTEGTRTMTLLLASIGGI